MSVKIPEKKEKLHASPPDISSVFAQLAQIFKAQEERQSMVERGSEG